MSGAIQCAKSSVRRRRRADVVVGAAKARKGFAYNPALTFRSLRSGAGNAPN